MSPALEFTCEFVTAFHTSKYNYSNLYTCAPYILGTTLRGAVLRALIDTDCTGMQLQPTPTFHNNCPDTCQIKPLFSPPTRFSFGEFLPDRRSGLRTRVGIDREGLCAAQGALLSTEVRHGRFSFRIMFPDSSLPDLIRQAVVWAGSRPDSGGIGRFRSAGWGQFRVIAETPYTPSSPRGGGYRYRFEFRTLYVLKEEFLNESQRLTELENQLRDSLPSELRATVHVATVELELKSLAYIRRWSDEHQHKENCQVAGRDSALVVTFSQPVAEEQIQLWQWGIGKWFESGFGSFEAKRLD